MKRNYILPLFLVFQIIFLKVISFFPEVIERYYSNGIYIYLSKSLRSVIGKIPFSVGDILYGTLIIYLLFSIWKTRKSWKLDWKKNLLKIVSAFSVVYFVFHLLWGFNYYRVPLYEKMQIDLEYTDEELYAFTEKLIAKTNEIQLKITHNKNAKVIISYDQEMIFEKAQNGYSNLAKEYPFFKYDVPSKKKSLFSMPLTYMGFSGYLNPFTNEAQVNCKIPMYSFPNVLCHEMAHQIGFGSESECNFIGFLAGIKNDDDYFKYAAYSNALHYCMANIGFKNQAKFNYLKQKINPGILENHKESEVFWQQYNTFIDKGFHAFYDKFLKLNQQQDGIESYSKFVNLLVGFSKTKVIF